jgi:hypothetical protein
VGGALGGNVIRACEQASGWTKDGDMHMVFSIYFGLLGGGQTEIWAREDTTETVESVCQLPSGSQI